LAVLAALTTLTLVLPNVATSEPGPFFNTSQLVFAGTVSLVLYGAFVFIQTIRQRDYFVLLDANDEDAHVPPPSNKMAAISAGLLVVALVAVVALAKALTPTVEAGLDRLGAPKAVMGIIITAVVLLPECLAALSAARANRLQTSLNLELGLGDKDRLLLALTLLIGVITLGTGPDDGAPGRRPLGDLRGIPVRRRRALRPIARNAALRSRETFRQPAGVSL
jgi:Ca2+:H+ antiporter